MTAVIREKLRQVLGTEPCPECGGEKRLDPEDIDGVQIAGKLCPECHGAGTRDIIDSLTTEEAVDRVVHERSVFKAVAEGHQRVLERMVEDESDLRNIIAEARAELKAGNVSQAERVLAKEAA